MKTKNKNMDFLNIIKIYFCELGGEICELFSNILKTKKLIMIVSGIILFILGCFIWRPLCLLTITGAIMLCATFCIMSIPTIGALITYISFHLSILDGDDEKYPLLNETLSVICSIIVFVFITYLVYDCVIKDLWYQPELWNEILNL